MPDNLLHQRIEDHALESVPSHERRNWQLVDFVLEHGGDRQDLDPAILRRSGNFCCRNKIDRIIALYHFHWRPTHEV